MGSDHLSDRGINAEAVYGTYQTGNTDTEQNCRDCTNQHQFRESEPLFHGA